MYFVLKFLDSDPGTVVHLFSPQPFQWRVEISPSFTELKMQISPREENFAPPLPTLTMCFV